MNMGMERWGFLLSVVSSPIEYFLKTTRAVCPNINPIMLCTHVCDLNYAACYPSFAIMHSPYKQLVCLAGHTSCKHRGLYGYGEILLLKYKN